MPHSLAPIPCKPWTLNGLSERLVTSHYENDYGAAVRSLNAIREELGVVDVAALPDHRIRALKREELAAIGSVLLHECYFESLGGDGAAPFTGSGPGTRIAESVVKALEDQFGTVTAWRREFAALGRALGGASGWVVLTYSRHDGRLSNHIALDAASAMIDAVPLLALDMFEHAYHLDFGANASAYVDAFMRNIDWSVVSDRLSHASGNHKWISRPGPGDGLPSISAEELIAALANGDPMQVIDARPRHYFTRSDAMMRGATWRDPDRLDDWVRELPGDSPVVVYCAYGYAVGCGVTAALRQRGIDARFVRGGLLAWYAAGGARRLRPDD